MTYAREREEVVVLIEAKINWTEERIIEEIENVFGVNAPQMIEVARCEGSKGGVIQAEIEGPTQDFGPFQIHWPTHHKHLEALGLDVKTNPQDNIKFAKILYDESGLQPWSASKHCWNK